MSEPPRRRRSDPLELIKNALDAIVDEMAIALMRSAYSTNIKTAMDMSTALCDAEGRLIAQGLTLPLHLGLDPGRDARGRGSSRARSSPGDVFLLNDPYQGGTHLPDFYLFKPIFRRASELGRLVGEHRAPDRRRRQDAGRQRLATRPRSTRRASASRRSSCTSAASRPTAIFELLDEERAGAAPGAGRRAGAGRRLPHRRARLPRAVERYGVDELAREHRALLDQAERLARNAIAAMPDGALHVHRLHRRRRPRPGPDPDRGHHHGRGRPPDRRLRRARRRRCAARSTRPIPFTKSTVYACVRHLIGGDPPNNEGYFRPIEVRGAGRARSSTRCCRRRSPRAG